MPNSSKESGKHELYPNLWIISRDSLVNHLTGIRQVRGSKDLQTNNVELVHDINITPPATHIFHYSSSNALSCAGKGSIQDQNWLSGFR